MRFLTVLALTACLTSVAMLPARAQDTAGLKKEMIGKWELSTTDRSKTCVVPMRGSPPTLTASW